MPDDDFLIRERRSRLVPMQMDEDLRPFVRAAGVTDISLYWMPISVFPMGAHAREWLLVFLNRLTSVVSKRTLRTEAFVLFKTLYPELLDRFLKTSSEYMPITGISIQPGVSPPELPSMEDVEAEIKKGGQINVHQWMADYCFWFLNKQGAEQRQDFLGHGGMLFLFMRPDSATNPPIIHTPKIMRTHPAFKDQDFEAKLASICSMKDGFLRKSKEVFGAPIREDAAYPGIPFVLPLFRATDLIRATPQIRMQWFQVFDGYCLESKLDAGFLVAMKDPDSIKHWFLCS